MKIIISCSPRLNNNHKNNNDDDDNNNDNNNNNNYNMFLTLNGFLTCFDIINSAVANSVTGGVSVRLHYLKLTTKPVCVGAASL